MTGQHIATSDSVASVTNECQLYTNLMDSEAASWLDTVGWEDKKKEDMESFRNAILILFIFCFLYHKIDLNYKV